MDIENIIVIKYIVILKLRFTLGKVKKGKY